MVYVSPTPPALAAGQSPFKAAEVQMPSTSGTALVGLTHTEQLTWAALLHKRHEETCGTQPGHLGDKYYTALSV